MANSANGIAPTDPKRMNGIFNHVMVRNPDDDWMFDGRPVAVIHDTFDRVWVGCSYSDDLPPAIVPVGDTLNNGYDGAGNRLVSVPAGWCTFLSEEDAAVITACIDADEWMVA